MVERDLLPDFSAAAMAELATIRTAPPQHTREIRDLTRLLWASIDNDDSRDLDQLTVAEPLSGDRVKILVAIADVDALVKKESAVDHHAAHNTTSVYTAAEIFPMLPEPLSTDLTSLAEGKDRLAIVIEMVLSADGELIASNLYRAVVNNHAKLAYNSVAAWLDDTGPPPERIRAARGLDEQLRIQDRIAQQLKQHRHQHGALSLETIEPRAVFDGEVVTDLAVERKNRAKELIEDFMIAANGVTARYLQSKGFPCLRRVLRSPERWQRIVELASRFGTHLPSEPDAKTLEDFLDTRQEADPMRFPDLSLAVVKLIGKGEYVFDSANGTPPGHFGLAVKAYTHSTAPNRRFPDLITQRLIKAALTGEPVPYTQEELKFLAAHCTAKEDVAEKVQRQIRKSAAALLLESKIGQRFDALVTGASEKGTWVRLLHPPVEGKLVAGGSGLDVGDRIAVKLLSTDAERGYIDFARTAH
jgi:exoribonuclease-2